MNRLPYIILFLSFAAAIALSHSTACAQDSASGRSVDSTSIGHVEQAPESGSSYTDAAAEKRGDIARDIGGVKSQVGLAIPSMHEQFGRVLKALLYCLAVGLVGFGFVRHFSKYGAGKELSGIEVISRRQIGPKTVLLVVNVLGKRFFLSQTPEDCHLLAELDPFEVTANAPNQQVSFAETLAIQEEGHNQR